MGVRAFRAPVSLSEVVLDANEKLLIPFTSSAVEVIIPWLDYPSLRGYLHCNGSDCLLCGIGRQTDPRVLFPIYDVLGKAVGMLPVSSNARPHALMPQLVPALRRALKNERVLIAAAKPERQKYKVAVLELPEDVDAGEDVILNFLEEFEAGRIDLTTIYQRLPNEMLATVSEVATLMKLRGITL